MANRNGLAALAAALVLIAPATAQDAGPEAPAADAPAAETEVYAEWDEVEVFDPVNDVWDPCTVLAVFKGAYKVSCNYEKSIRRDVDVRRPDGAAVGQTAAQPVTGAPFKRDDLVLVSLMGLPRDWRLCIVLRNEVAKSNSYAVDCGNDPQNALPQWVRKDPKAPR